MTVSKRYEAALAEARKTPEYWAEGMALEITSAVIGVMKEQNISQQELANRLQAKPSYVSRILNGPHNMTLATAARLLNAVGLGGVVRSVPIETSGPLRIASSARVVSMTTRRPFLDAIVGPVDVKYKRDYSPESSANEAYRVSPLRVGNGA